MEVVEEEVAQEQKEEVVEEAPLKQPCGLVLIGNDDSTKSAICGNIMKEACGIEASDY